MSRSFCSSRAISSSGFYRYIAISFISSSIGSRTSGCLHCENRSWAYCSSEREVWMWWLVAFLSLIMILRMLK